MKLVFIYTLIILFFSCDTQEKKDHPALNENDLITKANSYYHNDEYLLAKYFFDTLLLINPLNGEYYYKRAYCKYMLQNDNYGAISDNLNSIKYNYKNKKGAYLGIGTIYRIEGKYDSALYFYNKSLEIDSGYQKAKAEKVEILRIIKEQK